MVCLPVCSNGSSENSKITWSLDQTIISVLSADDRSAHFFREWTLKCDIFNAFLGLTFNGFNLK